ncbi:putative alcohol dehydrogenase (plasmid) [Cupriavidus necator H16]|uniref:Probable alcohol dehydrogenase n=1 Tax=Cupriavidus necator (strain ATCC 17699 / DSM 428 / KCTC 22496 / NCIMB 10442 / H16 / Stanier 337) TaxID=381666 RepID=Q7WXA7_CUPNH|nr:probable alcohol dehydrogenase [Cupriavidus necator H16]
MAQTMRAMIFEGAGLPLRLQDVPVPDPGPGEVCIAAAACEVCHTDLHIADGDLSHPKPALIPGHEAVGQVESCGTGVTAFSPGERVGVPWLGNTCGDCRYCMHLHGNLCDAPQLTGYTRDGGYAEYVVADSSYYFRIPPAYDDEHAEPLLCAGLIDYRTLRMAGEAQRIGIYGFGAAAHLVTQIAAAQGREVYGFTRAGDTGAQQLAYETGACWAGSSDLQSPVALDAALIFAPVGALVPCALRAVDKGERCRLRRHPHERHPAHALPAAMGRASPVFGRQPHARRRNCVDADRRPDAAADAHDRLPARAGQCGTGRSARGASVRCRRPENPSLRLRQISP